jgi:hypothetical protein
LRFDEFHLHSKDCCSFVEYPHLILVDIEDLDTHYVEHFLNETKIHLSCLITQLKIDYHNLTWLTGNFRRDVTRCNCAGVKRTIIQDSTVYPKDVYRYFPSLSI